MSKLQDQLRAQLDAARLPMPEEEVIFHPDRKWRFDMAWAELMLAVEIDGATWTRGRHARGKGIEADCEKYAEAMLLGWDVLRVTGDMVRSGRAVTVIEQLIDNRMGG